MGSNPTPSEEGWQNGNAPVLKTGGVFNPLEVRVLHPPQRSKIKIKIKIMKLVLSILPEKLGICHFPKNTPIPDWAKEISFCSITRTPDELSIICPQEKIPPGILVEKNWRTFKVQGPLGFSLTGIVASLSQPLAKAKISILYISTYETDYLLVEEKNLKRAEEILSTFCQIKK